jgi:uncharacterized protein
MTPETRIGAVFDCNTFLQAVGRETGPAFACLEAFARGEFDLYVSETILEEVREVLSRPELQEKFTALTPERVEALIERLDAKANLIVNIPEEFRYERDPDDEPYINLAIVTGAQYIVSRDRDLLDLMDESRAAGKAFCHRYPFLKIVDPAEFLDALRSP